MKVNQSCEIFIFVRATGLFIKIFITLYYITIILKFISVHLHIFVLVSLKYSSVFVYTLVKREKKRK